jgi:hypothetical protein
LISTCSQTLVIGEIPTTKQTPQKNQTKPNQKTKKMPTKQQQQKNKKSKPKTHPKTKEKKTKKKKKPGAQVLITP